MMWFMPITKRVPFDMPSTIMAYSESMWSMMASNIFRILTRRSSRKDRTMRRTRSVFPMRAKAGARLSSASQETQSERMMKTSKGSHVRA